MVTSNTQNPSTISSPKEEIQIQHDGYDTSLDLKEIVETLNIYSSFPEYEYMKDSVKMDFSTILDKPFHVDSFQWRTSDSVGFLKRYKAPYDFLTSTLSRIPFVSSNYWRGNICIILSVSGTPMHQGTLVVSATPHNTADNIVGSTASINTHFASPHMLLSPNNATASCLEMPFYYPVHYMKTLLNSDSGFVTTTDSTYFNSGYLNLYILNQLQGGATSSTSVTVNVSVKFDQLEFYVPKQIATAFAAESGFSQVVSGYIDGFFNGLRTMSGDLLDQCRTVLRAYTGLHNPNLPVLEHAVKMTSLNYQNIVEGPNFIERMDPFVNHDRVHSHPLFNTKVDEMYLPFLLSKPQYLNTFQVAATDVVGTNLVSIPISPYQLVNGSLYQQSIQNLIYYNTRYWRGDIVIYIHSSMSNLHFCKLLAVKQYATTPDAVAPLFSQVLNLPSQSLEFSSGGQILKVVIPYYQDKPQMFSTTDLLINSVQSGRFNVYLQQPLVNSGTTASTVNFNVFYSLENFTFYDYTTSNVDAVVLTDTDDFTNVIVQPPAEALGNLEVIRNLFKPTKFQAESSFTPYNINEQQLLEDVRVVQRVGHDDLRPLVHMRDILRRYKLVPLPTLPVVVVNKLLRTCCDPLGSLYFGFMGGLKVKIELPVDSTIQRVLYYPPNLSLDTTGAIQSVYPVPTTRTVSTSTPHNSSTQVKVFEFIITPQTPFKFNDFVGHNVPLPTVFPSATLGSLKFVDATGLFVNLPAENQIYVAMTDEARFGFQTRVPAIVPASTLSDGAVTLAQALPRYYYSS